MLVTETPDPMESLENIGNSQKKPFEPILIAFQQLLVLILGTYVFLPLIATSIVITVLVSKELPDDFPYLDGETRAEIYKEKIEKLQKEIQTNTKQIHQSYIKVMVKEKPWLLIVDRLIWALCFILPAYFILVRFFKAEYTNLSDPFNLKTMFTGAGLGALVFLFVIVFGFFLTKIFGKQTPNEFQEALFKEMQGNRSLLLWSIYSVGLITGIVEEVFFRGFCLRQFQGRGLEIPGLLFTSVVFGLVHYSEQTSVSVPILLSFVGMFFGLFYLKTGNIWYSISAHVSYNSIMLLIAYIKGGEIQ
ncbi:MULTISPECIES: CPBP family intramembrane glutamic endopeptidase [Leptospira]|uniref:CPBP family intramembrane metalloprotease domain-containing protein n=2 Tax=Leptospira kirschneri TaxID=29507 RepID=A0A1T1DRD9_9LEPT|nr:MULTISPECIES: CPBP family intramembrane glutamic endopeptidase [Leptospira]EMO78287.1 CAAX protease self-immunity [Leptospira kirschneri str. 200801925]EJO70989.1 CAAX protease self-immunity [Leptospira kirschneri serovar Grippotyphosa str. RM52]EKO49614.1 CAAX protease self-immunity [Leptospira kirschneri str. 200802841]EKP03683.1 CAAX protease self-immunity [Leptospira kirschneri str. 2008720114]EKQ83745.1 CAAX protease self-immunity [Leptospira kirschneri serovar Grippotyphosa str. Moskv